MPQSEKGYTESGKSAGETERELGESWSEASLWEGVGHLSGVRALWMVLIDWKTKWQWINSGGATPGHLDPNEGYRPDALGYEIYRKFMRPLRRRRQKRHIRESTILKEHYIFFGTFLYLHCTTTTEIPVFLYLFFYWTWMRSPSIQLQEISPTHDLE